MVIGNTLFGGERPSPLQASAFDALEEVLFLSFQLCAELDAAVRQNEIAQDMPVLLHRYAARVARSHFDT